MMGKQQGETGIIVSVPVGKKGKGAVGAACLLFLYFLLGFYGAAYGLAVTFFPVYGNSMLAAGLALMSVFYLILYKIQKRLRFSIMFTGAVYGVLLYHNWESLQEGGKVLLDEIRNTAWGYTGNMWEPPALHAEGAEHAFIFLLFLFFLWGGILFYGIFRKSGRQITILNAGLVIGTALAIGMVPPFPCTCFLIFCCLGVFASADIPNGKVRIKSALYIGVAGLVCLFLAAQGGTSVLEPFFENRLEIRERIQQTSLLQELRGYIPSLTGAYATGGIGRGDLSGVESITYSGKTALEVTTEKKPDETIYLKGFTGAHYTSQKWEVREDPENDAVNEFYFGRASELAWENSVNNPLSIEIERKGADRDFFYIPYFSRMIEGEDKKQYSFQYYPWKRVDFWHWEKLNANGLELGAAPPPIDYGSYLEYPQDHGLYALCDSPWEGSLEELISHVKKTLAETATYNLQVGKAPEEKDFVEYFMFEKKEGYCVHFATTAVLMFRMYGIPARYAEGYIVPLKDFKKADGVYKAEVKDERAHAWAEIYIFGEGWIPVETTPGYAQGGSRPGQGESDNEAQKNTGLAEKESSSGQTEENGSNERQKEKDKGEATGWLLRLGYLLGALVLLGILLGIHRILMLRKRKSKGVRELFHDMYEVLVMGGWKDAEKCADSAFASQAARQFPWMEEQKFSQVMEIVMQANYGKEPVSAEETALVRGMYRTVCREVGQNLSKWKKFQANYIKVYF